MERGRKSREEERGRARGGKGVRLECGERGEGKARGQVGGRAVECQNVTAVSGLSAALAQPNFYPF